MKTCPTIGTLRYWASHVEDEDEASAAMLVLVEQYADGDEEGAYDYIVRLMRVAVMGLPREADLIDWFEINGGLHG